MFGEIAMLALLPHRCPLAPEANVTDREIRHLIIGDYRALFLVRSRTVHVLGVRHGRMRPATKAELTGAIEEAGLDPPERDQ